MLLPFLLGIVLAVTHFLSDKAPLLSRKNQMKFTSFSAGIFVAYLILHLFPTLLTGDIVLTRVSLIFVLAGFSLFHLLEKLVYRHETKDVDMLRKELKGVHSVAFFLYHVVIGIVLLNILAFDLATGLLFFVPILLHTVFSSIALKEVHGRVRQKRGIKILLSFSTLIGIALALAVSIPALTYHILLGFIVGSSLYIFLVDAIPRERKGEPSFFILGVALYGIFIGLTWLV